MLRVKATIGLLLAAVLACGGCPVGDPLVDGPPRVRITTSLGEFLVELDPNDAPLTVANFLQYVNEGFYDGTIFHRVIPDFVVQGGGYLPGLEAKPTHDPIASEASNGLLNLRGTVAMARTDDQNSATSQFYVNVADSPTLDPSATSAGYTVFGRVIEGLLTPWARERDYPVISVEVDGNQLQPSIVNKLNIFMVNVLRHGGEDNIGALIEELAEAKVEVEKLDA